MNIDEIEDRVRATVGSLDVRPRGVSAVVTEGERRRKRTRTVGAVLATVGAVVVVAGLSQVLAGPFDGRAVPPATGPSNGLTSPATPQPNPDSTDALVKIIPLDQRGDPVDLAGASVDGTALDVADFRGEVVLVPFWGSWCKPCQQSVALVDGLARDQGVAVVGVALDEASAEGFRSAEAAAAVSFESIFNPSETVLHGLGDMRPIASPTTLVLDSEGRVAAQALGPFTSASGLTSAVALLQQQDAVSDGLALPNLLTVENQTDQPIWVTFSNGNRAEVKPARQFQLGSQRACSLMPLTATSMDGTTIDTFDEPCAGQTWTIGPGLVSIPPAGASPVGQPPSRSELIGTWRPLNLLGGDVRRLREVNGNRNVISFSDGQADLAWRAYDGCNWTSGTARLSGSGALAARSRSTTARGCAGPGPDLVIPNADVIEMAENVLLDGDVLRLYTSTGELLGEYERTVPGI